MSRGRKGVSPIIAVVILIAVAVSIGIMVTTWVTHWVTTQTSSEDLTCSINTNYVIDNAKFNSTGNDQLLLKITNKGKQGIYGFGIVMDNGTNVIQINSSAVQYLTNATRPTYNISGIPQILRMDINPANSEASPIKQEQSVYINLNLTDDNTTSRWLDNFGFTLSEIRITNLACPSIVARTTTITLPS